MPLLRFPSLNRHHHHHYIIITIRLMTDGGGWPGPYRADYCVLQHSLFLKEDGHDVVAVASTNQAGQTAAFTLTVHTNDCPFTIVPIPSLGGSLSSSSSSSDLLCSPDSLTDPNRQARARPSPISRGFGTPTMTATRWSAPGSRSRPPTRPSSSPTSPWPPHPLAAATMAAMMMMLLVVVMMMYVRLASMNSLLPLPS